MTSTLAEKAPGSPSAPAKARAGARRAKRRRTALFFMAPALVGFLVFFGYPLIATVYYSFTKYDLINPPQFIGFDNYVRMFTTEPLVGVAAYNTLWLVVILTTCRVLFSLGIASVISRLKSGVGLVRTLCYLPTLAPPAAATLAFVFVFNPEFGPVNRFLRLIGIDGGLWFNSPAMSKPALTLLALWGSGELMIIILAALLDVPTEQYEAAELDGATGPQVLARHAAVDLAGAAVRRGQLDHLRAAVLHAGDRRGVRFGGHGRRRRQLETHRRARKLDADVPDLAVRPGFPLLQHGLRGGDGGAAVHRFGGLHLDSGAAAA